VSILITVPLEEVHMDKADVVARLRVYRNSVFPILTVYLGCSEKRPPQVSFCLSQLHSLVHQNLTQDEQKFWQKDINRIEEYLHQSFNRSNTRTTAFFSAGKNLWEALKFEFFLQPFLVVSHSPNLKPIEQALRKYRKYLVLLVDRAKARMFTVHLGEIEEHKDIFNGKVPQRVKAKKTDYGRDDKIPRHIEDDLRRHLELLASEAKEFLKGKKSHFIILGSHKEMLPKIKQTLPYPLNKMVAGEFVTELNVPLSRVLSLSKKIASQINQKL